MVGPCLCGLLQTRSIPFTTLGRGPNGNDISADLSHPDTVCIEDRFDVLIHMAPLWLLPDNLERMIAAGVRRVIAFSSTSAESKRHSPDAGDRALAVALVSAEDRLKAHAAATNIGLTLFRPTMIYGYGRDGNVMAIARLIKKLGFFPIAGQGKGLRQPVHAGDLADAALSCLATASTAGRTYNLGGAEVLSYTDLVGRIFTALGRKPRVIHVAPTIYGALMGIAATLKLTGGVSPGAAERMNEDLCFDARSAETDFGYRGSAFLTDPKRDLPV